MSGVNKTFVIIGGGPVGLFCAWRLAEANPAFEIEVWEKRETYTRKQVLILQPDIVEVMSELLEGHPDACYVRPPPLVNKATCYARVLKGAVAGPKLVSVPTWVLEETLERKLREYENVKVRKGSECPRMAEGKGVVYIVAEGAACRYGERLGIKSMEKAFDNEAYGAVAFLDCKKLPTVKQGKAGVNMNKKPQHVHRVFPVPSRGFTYVGLALSKREHGTLGGRNAWNVEEMPRGVRDKLQTAIKYHGLGKFCDASKATGVAAFPITFRYLEKPGMVHKRNAVVFLGDSAFTAHFFSGQGVNSGFRCAKKIAELYGGKGRKVRREILSKYNEFASQERETQWGRYNDIILDFDARKECEHMTKKRVLHLAKEKGVAARGLSGPELCSLL